MRAPDKVVESCTSSESIRSALPRAIYSYKAPVRYQVSSYPLCPTRNEVGSQVRHKPMATEALTVWYVVVLLLRR